MSVVSVSEANLEFWNELCGSQLAKVLGISDSSPASLKRFDDWYFNFYPYLDRHIRFGELKGKDVLEIGMGYGTVAQKLAECGANYTGLDIAQGPVSMVNHRLAQAQLSGNAIKGSILAPPIPSECFDAVVAIGCLHHTGDLQTAIHNCYTLLRPGGRLTFMVYYAYSYRRWARSPLDTAKYLVSELRGHRDVVGGSAGHQRAAYDKNEAGDGAPHTDWISATSLQQLCHRFSSFTAVTENVAQEFPLRRWTRDQLMETFVPRKMGLDLYATAIK